MYRKPPANNPDAVADYSALRSQIATEKWLQGRSGFPADADCCAYEPFQGLLAIACPDGLVKVYGGNGVERTLVPTVRENVGTGQLLFLPNKAVLIRVSKGGWAECWSLVSTVDNITPFTCLRCKPDTVTCVAALPRDPYVVFGCTSGSLRTAVLQGSWGGPAAGSAEVVKVALSGYRVKAEELEAEGHVVSIAAQSIGPVHRLLALYSTSGASIWDIRASRLLGSVNPSKPKAISAVKRAGAVCSACWIGTQKGDFATGHHNGDIFIWILPQTENDMLMVISPIRLVDGGASPVRHLSMVMSEHECLLALGGQADDQPETLTLLSIPRPAQVITDPTSQVYDEAQNDEGPELRNKIPWFGTIVDFALVSTTSDLMGVVDPAGIVMLMEDGKLMCYDIHGCKPNLMNTPFQSMPPPSSMLVSCLPLSSLTAKSAQSVNLFALRKLAAMNAHEHQSQGVPKWLLGEPGMYHFSQPEDSVPMVLVTGHQSGAICLWDVASLTLIRLFAVGDPNSSTTPRGTAAKPVTALAFSWEHGVLVSGHDKGEVRLYQFHDRARSTECLSLSSVGRQAKPQVTSIDSEPGFQFKLRLHDIHTHAITSVVYAPTIQRLAIADCMGGVSLVDVLGPSVLWYNLFPQAVVSLAFTALAPEARCRKAGSLDDSSMVLVLGLQDSSSAILDMSTGNSVVPNARTTPKTKSTLVALELLDANFNPTWMCPTLALKTGMASPRRTESPLTQKGSEPFPPSDSGRQGSGSLQESSSVPLSASNPQTADDLPDGLDVDAYLAAAAAQVQEQVRTEKLAKVAKVVTLGLVKDKEEPSKKGVKPTFKANTIDGRSPKPINTNAGSGSDPNMQSGTAQPAVYVLLCTEDLLRIYELSVVMAGSRDTVRKVKLAYPLLAASTVVVAPQTPLLMCLVKFEEGIMAQYYSLPALDLVTELGSVLALSGGLWPLPGCEVLKPGALQCGTALARDGRLWVLGPNDEVYHLGVLKTAPAPSVWPVLYDSDLAMAAQSASMASEQALVALKQQRTTAVRAGAIFQGPLDDARVGSIRNPMGTDNLPEAVHDGPQSYSNTRPSSRKDKLLGLLPRESLNKDKGMALLDKGLNQFKQVMDKGVNLVTGLAVTGDARSLSPGGTTTASVPATSNLSGSSGPEELPDLDIVFSKIRMDDISDLESQTSLSSPPAAAVPPSFHGQALQYRAKPHAPPPPIYQAPAGTTLNVTDDTSRRAALFGTGFFSRSSEPAGGPPRVRTTSEIKRAYGHEKKAADNVGAIAAENRNKLVERGEKLRNMQDKAEDLENAAADFATLAKRLADQQRNRKWWQL